MSELYPYVMWTSLIVDYVLHNNTIAILNAVQGSFESIVIRLSWKLMHFTRIYGDTVMFLLKCWWDLFVKATLQLNSLEIF